MPESFLAQEPEQLFDRVGVHAGMHVADLGCGRSGSIIFAAARRVGDEGLVYAVDIIPEVLEHLNGRMQAEGHDNIQVIWSDIETVGKTAIPSQSLDRCFLHNVLSSIVAEDRALEEARRLLKNDGRLLVIDWAKSLGPHGAIPSRLIDPEIIKRHAARLGLLPIEQFSWGGYHYGLILAKQ